MPEGGHDLDLDDPALARLLDRATQLALAVATKDAREKRPLDVPAPLRPLLRHRKLTTAAKAVLRRTVDEDDAFRARVVEELGVEGDDTVGAAGALFLRRPESWLDDLQSLAAAEGLERAKGDEAIDERRTARRLRAAEARVAEVAAEAAEARLVAERARTEALEGRRAARAALDEAASVQERLADAERRAAAGESALAEAQASAALLESDVLEVRSDRDRLTSELSAAQVEIVGLRHALREAAPSGVPTEEPPAKGPADAASAVVAAGRAAAELGAALALAGAFLAEEVEGDDVDARAGTVAPTSAPVRRRSGPRRRPAPLPPLVLEGSDDEADHLVRLDGVTILVDGYNATIGEWPGLDLPDQRSRLVDLLSGLAMRFGAHVEVVFDGGDVVDIPVPTPARRLVRVSFTEADVEADDVIIDRARHLPLPVVVVSGDNRVRNGSRAAGANVLSVPQLLGTARRP